MVCSSAIQLLLGHYHKYCNWYLREKSGIRHTQHPKRCGIMLQTHRIRRFTHKSIGFVVVFIEYIQLIESEREKIVWHSMYWAPLHQTLQMIERESTGGVVGCEKKIMCTKLFLYIDSNFLLFKSRGYQKHFNRSLAGVRAHFKNIFMLIQRNDLACLSLFVVFFYYHDRGFDCPPSDSEHSDLHQHNYGVYHYHQLTHSE